jgi:hypothetical protein
MRARRICSVFQKRRDRFKGYAVKVMYRDIQSCIDETVAFIRKLFEAIALTPRELPNCKFALHIVAAVSTKCGESPARLRRRFNR